MKLTALIHYIGQTPIRAGRIGLAVILWRSDFDAFAQLGKPITEATYIKARVPGEPTCPRGLFAAALNGWRWGGIQHRLTTGTLTARDATWVAEQWRDGVPV